MSTDRATYIGSTEAAAACGVSEYRTALDVYLLKTGLVEPEPDNEAMEAGRILEPAVIQLYHARNGTPPIEYPSRLHRLAGCDWIGATPDAIAGVTGGKWCVDAKTSTWRSAANWGEPGTDDVPIDYLMQAQQHMLCTGLDRCDLVVMFDPRTVRTYTVHAHEGLHARMVEAETELWQAIQRREPPEPDYSHRGCLESVKRLHGQVEPGKCVELDYEASREWRDIRAMKATIREMEADIVGAEARLRHIIGDAEAARLTDGTELRRVFVRETLVTQADVDKLAARVGQVARRGYDYFKEKARKK